MKIPSLKDASAIFDFLASIFKKIDNREQKTGSVEPVTRKEQIMAFTMKLEIDYTTVVDLMDSNHGVMAESYVPATGEAGARRVSESLVVRIKGSSVSDLQTKIREIESFFQRAREFRDGTGQGKRAILRYNVNGDTESTIYDGRVDLSGKLMSVDWANVETDVTLTWTRDAWFAFYGGSLAQLTLANDNNGVEEIVYNCNDQSGSSPTKKENWVKIAAADIAGDLPCGCRIALYPQGTAEIDDIFIFNYVDKGHDSLAKGFGLHEGETGTSDTVDATRSGGKYHDYTIPSAPTALDINYDITADCPKYSGQMSRFLLAAKFTGTATFQPYVKIGGVGTYYGPKTVITGLGSSFEILDLGMLRIPPVDAVSNFAVDYSSVTAGFLTTQSGGGTLSMDCLQILPNMYAARATFPINATSTNSDILMVDSMAYADPAGNKAYIWTLPGADLLVKSLGTLYGQILLYPGFDNYLMFRWRKDGVDIPMDSAIIAVIGRSRYRTV